MTNIIQWLLPKEEKFFDMLREQASNVVDGANEFKRLIDDYNKINDSERKNFAKWIQDIEHKGDNLTHNIIGILDKTFITPIDKEDIYRLAMLLDDVIDAIYHTSERLIIFKISKIDIHIKNLTHVVLEITKKMDIGIAEISKLKDMNQFYIEVHTLENKGDNLYRAALAEMFNKRNPIEIIKYKDIYDFLENIADKCEDIANVIESIVVKHA